MARQSDSDGFASSPAGSRGWLRELIDSLHDLVILIASRLRHAQVQQSPIGDPKGDYDIWKKLGSHVEQLSAESRPDARPPAPGKATAIPPRHHEDQTAMDGEPNELTEHSRRQAVDRLLPRMHEQMQNKTMEHINISLILAREGNVDGARLHIDLAESAMHTASRFMSHEEYEIFEQKIERRMESVIGGNQPDESTK